MCILLKSYSDYAAIETPNFCLNPEMVNIPDAINTVIESYNEFSKVKDINIELCYAQDSCPQDLQMWPTDERRFQIIVSALLHNSIKFCKFSGNVELRVHHTKEVLFMTVQDDGCGIKTEDL
jgi:signal transduction histidine kinase